MHKYAPYIFVLFLAACIAACGGKSSSTPTSVYDHPATLAPSNTLMGGAVQGTPLVLRDGNTNTVSTLAGTAGSAGFNNYSGHNGAPAKFNIPDDITYDGIGKNFFVTDYGNSLIRKITPLGLVTTLQCTDEATGLPVGFNRPAGITTDGINLYVVDSGSNSVRVININTSKVTMTIGSATGLPGSVDSTDRTAARFNLPIGITTDGVNLYVTDYNNATVRRIDIGTGAVSTLAGISGASGSIDGAPATARFNLPNRITTDRANLYVTDFYSRTIRKIDILTGTVSTIAGSVGPLSMDAGTTDGIGTAARFNQPYGITTDGTNLYMTDAYQNTVRKIVIATGAVTTISGIPKLAGDKTLGEGGSVDSPGTPSFYSPAGITTDGVALYVVDSYNNTIRKIEAPP